MRSYRWQDPAPAPLAAIRERRMRLRVFERGTQPSVKHAPEQPSMVLDGVEYVEAPEVSWCHECAFKVGDGDGCMDAERAAQKAFGGTCEERSVIYIRKA